MNKENIREKIKRLKVKAETFLKNDIRAFIKTYSGDYFFCDILIVGDIRLEVHNFIGKRKGTNSNIFWPDIISIEEYKPLEDIK